MACTIVRVLRTKKNPPTAVLWNSRRCERSSVVSCCKLISWNCEKHLKTSETKVAASARISNVLRGMLSSAFQVHGQKISSASSHRGDSPASAGSEARAEVTLALVVVAVHCQILPALSILEILPGAKVIEQQPPRLDRARPPSQTAETCRMMLGRCSAEFSRFARQRSD